MWILLENIVGANLYNKSNVTMYNLPNVQGAKICFFHVAFIIELKHPLPPVCKTCRKSLEMKSNFKCTSLIISFPCHIWNQIVVKISFLIYCKIQKYFNGRIWFLQVYDVDMCQPLFQMKTNMFQIPKQNSYILSSMFLFFKWLPCRKPHAFVCLDYGCNHKCCCLVGAIKFAYDKCNLCCCMFPYARMKSNIVQNWITNAKKQYEGNMQKDLRWLHYTWQLHQPQTHLRTPREWLRQKQTNKHTYWPNISTLYLTTLRHCKEWSSINIKALLRMDKHNQYAQNTKYLIFSTPCFTTQTAWASPTVSTTFPASFATVITIMCCIPSTSVSFARFCVLYEAHLLRLASAGLEILGSAVYVAWVPINCPCFPMLFAIRVSPRENHKGWPNWFLTWCQTLLDVYKSAKLEPNAHDACCKKDVKKTHNTT